MAIDNYSGSAQSILASASNAAEVTPHDVNELTHVTTGIWVGGDGDITCRFQDASADVTIVGCVAGTLLPFQLTHIRATDTTATDLLAVW